jgi:hypothetical protein
VDTACRPHMRAVRFGAHCSSGAQAAWHNARGVSHLAHSTNLHGLPRSLLHPVLVILGQGWLLCSSMLQQPF